MGSVPKPLCEVDISKVLLFFLGLISKISLYFLPPKHVYIYSKTYSQPKLHKYAIISHRAPSVKGLPMLNMEEKSNNFTKFLKTYALCGPLQD